MYKNNFEILGNIVKVEILSPKYGYIYTVIDMCDLELLKEYKLRVKYDKTINNYYIYTGKMQDGKWKIKALHRIITDCPVGLQVDHLNRNPLDNIRSNLRICTNKINANNRGVRCTNKVGVTGISYNTKTNRYIVRNNNNGHRKYIGLYKTEVEALNALKEVIAHAL